ncbi:homeobox protein 5 isoform X2 [Wyeomyia smithii]|uniref:homeobox protein 5 isoform X2 n=1 Tax=Wyeomyia smithii TaxID=174621 RepID=UPI002467BA33|nr:homeobox protein 5 isoform X2 [Wyeomyia smithii]
MLLTYLASSACPLTVPPAAQSQLPSKQQFDITIGSSTGKVPATTQMDSPQKQLQQQQKQQPIHSNGQRIVDSVSSIDLIRFWPDTPPDLYNITLRAMKQYIRSQLNSTRYGKAPRKRSHHHNDSDFDFYLKFKEYNNSHSSSLKSAGVLASGGNKSFSSSFPQSNQSWFNASFGSPSKTADVSHLGIQVDDPLASYNLPEGQEVVKCEEMASEKGGDLRGSRVNQQTATATGTTNQKDYNVLMDDPRGYITASSSYPQRPAKTTSWDTAFIRHRGYVYCLLSFSLIGVVVLGLFGVYRCLRVTASRAPPEALALPIQFITDDLAAAVAAPLNADSNHPSVPMLSVQSPGCAGMERLGVPARSSIGSPPLRDERRRLRVDSGVANATTSSSAIYQHHPNVHHHSHHALHQHDHQSTTSSNFISNHNYHHSQFHQTTAATTANSIRHQTSLTTATSSATTAQKANSPTTDANGSVGGSSGSSGYGKANHHYQGSNSFFGGSNGTNNNTSLCGNSSISRCPYHVALPDGERGPDRDLQIRTSCQQSEIPRTYVKAPPNKTVGDVPAQYQSGASSTSSSRSNLNSQLRGSGVSSLSHSLSGGSASLGNRAIANSLSTLGSSGHHGSSISGSSSQHHQTQPKSDKSEKLKQILRFLPGNKTSKSSTSGINVNNSGNSSSNNNNYGPNSSSTSCNNNNYQTRSNSYGNGSVIGASGSRVGGLSSSGGSNLAVSGIHNHNHHYRQSTTSVQHRQQQQQQQTGLSSSVPSASSSSLNQQQGSSTPMSLSTSPSPDTSTHYM